MAPRRALASSSPVRWRANAEGGSPAIAESEALRVSTMTASLDDWNPGLYNDERTLREVYDSMPRVGAPPVPWYVKLLENPASPVALVGAVDLFEHDCIHIVLGRGALQQDEAFVVGFTMGASGQLSPLQHRFFTLCSRFLYRGAYRFSRIDGMVFDLAVESAVHMNPAPLERVDFAALMERPLGEIRASLRIDSTQLTEAFERERRLCPESPASLRLPRPSRVDTESASGLLGRAGPPTLG